MTDTVTLDPATITGDIKWPPYPDGLVEPREVKIWWYDALSRGNHWYTLDEIKQFKLEVCITKGFIVAEDEISYSVAETISDTGAHNVFLIPKGCVLKLI